jgi:4-amino-4-deoxy-L-arabinose transferase-like glycosyltransferase
MNQFITLAKTKLIKFDKTLDQRFFILLLLLLLTVLRIPGFFEPYWYGDEAIYLTVGQSIRAGQKLYTEIVDHKTPLIYYFAAVPNQFWFRVLFFVWMVITTILFNQLANIVIRNKFVRWMAVIIFVVLTTLPTFEGHIPNGELFVMGFIIAGLWTLTQSKYLSTYLSLNKVKSVDIKLSKQVITLLLAGFLSGLALLTKVPALLDFAGLLLIPWFYFSHQVISHLPSYGLILKTSWQKVVSLVNPASSDRQKQILHDIFLTKGKTLAKDIIQALFKIAQHWLLLFIGLLIPVILSVIYFKAVGSIDDYLQFGLLYNLHYSQSWVHNFSYPIVNFLFSLPGKTLVLALLLISLTLIKQLSVKMKFFSGWFLLTVYAVLLSNRPYPHYFLQSIPPLVLMLAGAAESLLAVIKKKKGRQLWPVITSTFYLGLAITALLTLNFGSYSTSEYYQNFYQYATGKINQEEYYQSFNYLMRDNYQLASFLKEQSTKRLFIWGDNAMLYALSETVPVGRFTVAFHILDLNAYQETMNAITLQQPKFIVVMNNAPKNFPEFYQYLNQHYSPNHSYQYMTLYRRVTIE